MINEVPHLNSHFSVLQAFMYQWSKNLCILAQCVDLTVQTPPPSALTDQWIWGADLSLVVVGRSFTVANGFVPLKWERGGKCYTILRTLCCAPPKHTHLIQVRKPTPHSPHWRSLNFHFWVRNVHHGSVFYNSNCLLFWKVAVRIRSQLVEFSSSSLCTW